MCEWVSESYYLSKEEIPALQRFKWACNNYLITHDKKNKNKKNNNAGVPFRWVFLYWPFKMKGTLSWFSFLFPIIFLVNQAKLKHKKKNKKKKKNKTNKNKKQNKPEICHSHWWHARRQEPETPVRNF